MQKTNPEQPPNPPSGKKPPGRTIGLDVHPDSFAAAIREGADPLKARVLQSVTQVPLVNLETWAVKHTAPGDTLVIEASSNTFSVVDRLEKIGRRAVILESHRAGQIGAAYLANDKLDAAKLARI